MVNYTNFKQWRYFENKDITKYEHNLVGFIRIFYIEFKWKRNG